MTILIYPITEGVWSFRQQEGGKPVRVEVPRGSELLPVKSVGLLLFVPGMVPLIRGSWNPRQVLAEASRPGGRFRMSETVEVEGEHPGCTGDPAR